jgi:hypothetical protein
LPKKKKHASSEHTWPIFEKMFEKQKKHYATNMEDLIKMYFGKLNDKVALVNPEKAVLLTNQQIETVYKMLGPEHKERLQKYISNLKSFNKENLNLVSSDFFLAIQNEDKTTNGNLLGSIARYLNLDNCIIDLDKENIKLLLSSDHAGDTDLFRLRKPVKASNQSSNLQYSSQKIISNISNFFSMVPMKDIGKSPKTHGSFVTRLESKPEDLEDDIELDNVLSKLKLRNIVPREFTLRDLDGKKERREKEQLSLQAQIINLKEDDFERLCTALQRPDLVTKKREGLMTKEEYNSLEILLRKTIPQSANSNLKSKKFKDISLPEAIENLELIKVKTDLESLESFKFKMPKLQNLFDQFNSLPILSKEAKEKLKQRIRAVVRVLNSKDDMSLKQLIEKLKEVDDEELQDELARFCSEVVLHTSERFKKYSSSMVHLKGTELLQHIADNLGEAGLNVGGKAFGARLDAFRQKDVIKLSETDALVHRAKLKDWVKILKTDEDKRVFLNQLISTGQLSTLKKQFKDLSPQDMLLQLEKELGAEFEFKGFPRANQVISLNDKGLKPLEVLSHEELMRIVGNEETARLVMEEIRGRAKYLTAENKVVKTKEVAEYLEKLKKDKKGVVRTIVEKNQNSEKLVKVNPLKLVENLILAGDKVDKKTIEKNAERMKDWLAKNDVDVNFDDVKGDEVGKLKKIYKALKENPAVLKNADLMMMKKEVEEALKGGNGETEDVVVFEDRPKYNPNQDVKVDALKLAENILLNTQMDKKTIGKNAEKIKDWLAKNNIDVNFDDVKGDDVGKMKKVYEALKENPNVLKNSDFTLVKKDLDEVCKKTKTAMEDLVSEAPVDKVSKVSKKEKIKQMKPTEEVKVDPLKLVENLILAGDKVDKKTIEKNAERMKDWLAKNDVDVNFDDVKGDEVGKLKKIYKALKENPAVLKNADLMMMKKEVEEALKGGNGETEDVVVFEDRPKYNPNQDVKVDALKLAENILLNTQMDKKTIGKNAEKIKDWLAKNNIDVNFDDVKGDDVGKMKKVYEALKENPNVLKNSDFTLVKKDLDEVCKKTKTAMEDLVSEAPVDKVSKVSKKEKIKQMKPTEEVKVDPLKLVENLILAGDKVDKKTIEKNAERMKDWLAKNDVDVNFDDVKGDEVGKLKKIYKALKENPAVLKNADLMMMKKEVEEALKGGNGETEDVVVFEDRPKYNPNQDVKVDALKLAENILLNTQMDKKTIGKNAEKIKDWLAKNNIDVNFDDVKGDDVGKMKKVYEALKENPNVLKNSDFTLVKKDLDEVCKKTKTAMEDLVSEAPVDKVSKVSKKEKIKQMKPTEEVKVDPLKLVENLILAGDKVDKKTIEKNAERMKDWLAKNDVDVNFDDVKGDEVGKLKKIYKALKENPAVLKNADLMMMKKEVEEALKGGNGETEDVVVFEDRPKYNPNQDVKVDALKLAENILLNTQMDKKTIGKNAEKIKDWLAKNNIDVNFDDVKGDDVGKMKKVYEALKENPNVLKNSDFTLVKKDLDEVCKKTKTAMEDLVSEAPVDKVSKVSKKEKIKQMKPTEEVKVDPLKLVENLILAGDKVDKKTIEKNAERMKDWLAKNDVDVNFDDVKGDEVGKLKKIYKALKENPAVLKNADLMMMKKEVEEALKGGNGETEDVVVFEDRPKYNPNQDVKVDALKLAENILLNTQMDKKTIGKNAEKIKDWLAKNNIDVNFDDVKGDDVGKMKKVYEALKENPNVLKNSDFTLVKKDLDEVCKKTKTAMEDLVSEAPVDKVSKVSKKEKIKQMKPTEEVKVDPLKLVENLILAGDKVDKKTIEKNAERMKDWLAKNDVDVNFDDVKGDEVGKLKKIYKALKENPAVLKNADLMMMKKEVEEALKGGNGETEDVVVFEDRPKYNPNQDVKVDALKLAENILLNTQMDKKTIGKNAEKIKDWLAKNNIDVNFDDVKGDDVGKMKKVYEALKENPNVLKNSDFTLVKKDLDEVCKKTKTAMEDLVSEAPVDKVSKVSKKEKIKQMKPTEEVKVDPLKLVENLILAGDKVDKKTIEKNAERMKDWLAKNDVDVNFDDVKGDEVGKLKKIYKALKENPAVLKNADLMMMKKEVEEALKGGNGETEDVVVFEDRPKYNPNQDVKVDALKLAENILLNTQMDKKTIGKNAEKIKDWLAKNNIDVNFDDVKGDDVGKMKKVYEALKENPNVLKNSDFTLVKKDLDEVCKKTKTAMEDLVSEAPVDKVSKVSKKEKIKQMKPTEEVKVDPLKLVENLILAGDKVDKKTIEKNAERMKDWLAKNDVDVNFDDVKGDEVGKLKKIYKALKENPAVLKNADLMMMKKEVEEALKGGNGETEDVVVFEDRPKYNPNQDVKVDALKLAENILLNTQMDKKTIGKNAEKIKDWLAKNNIDVNFDDVKGDDVGKMKKVYEALKENPNVLKNSDFTLVKKDLDEVCKKTKTAMEDLVSEAPVDKVSKVSKKEKIKQMKPTEEVKVDPLKLVENLILAGDKVDKKTIEKNAERMKDWLAKNDVDVNFDDVKGDEVGKLKKIYKALKENPAVLKNADLMMMKKEVEEALKGGNGETEDVVVFEDRPKYNPNQDVKVDALKLAENILLNTQMDKKTIGKNAEKIKDWLAKNNIDVNFDDVKGDDVGKMKKVYEALKENPNVLKNSDFTLVKKDLDEVCKKTKTAMEDLVSEAPVDKVSKVSKKEKIKQMKPTEEVKVDPLKLVENLILAGDKVDKKTIEKNAERMKDWLAKNDVDVNFDDVKGDEVGKLKKIYKALKENPAVLKNADLMMMKKEVEEALKGGNGETEDVVVFEDRPKYNPNQDVKVDALKLAENILLNTQMDKKTIGKNAEKIKDWLAKNNIDVNFDDVKGDDVGKMKKVYEALKENPNVLKNSDFTLVKKDLDEVCKKTKTAMEDLVSEAPVDKVSKVSKKEKIKQMKPTEEVKVDPLKLVENLILAGDKVDKKTIEKNAERMKDWLAKNDVDVNFDDVKGDEVGKLKKIYKALKENPAVLKNADLMMMKKEVEEALKGGNGETEDVVVFEDRPKYNPNQDVKVDALKLAENILLNTQMDKKTIGKNAEKIKDWLAKNNIDVNFDDVKGDDVGKMKKVYEALKENPNVLKNSDFTLVKKDLDEVCKKTKTAMEDLVSEAPVDKVSKVSKKEKIKQMKPTEEVKVDPLKLVENLILAGDKVDKKTIEKNAERMKDWLAKNDVDVNFDDVKGDEVGKLKKIYKALKENPAVLKNADLMMMKKEVEEALKGGNGETEDVVVFEDRPKYNPNQDVKVDALKLAENILLNTQMDKKTIGKNAEKIKDWLAKHHIFINFDDVKGDDVGKMKKVYRALASRPAFVASHPFFIPFFDLPLVSELPTVPVPDLLFHFDYLHNLVAGNFPDRVKAELDLYKLDLLPSDTFLDRYYKWTNLKSAIFSRADFSHLFLHSTRTEMVQSSHVAFTANDLTVICNLLKSNSLDELSIARQLEAYILDVIFDLEIPETKKDEILRRVISSNQSLHKLIVLCKEHHLGFNIHQPFKFSLYGSQSSLVTNQFSQLKRILQQHAIENLDLPESQNSKKMMGHLLSNQVGPAIMNFAAYTLLQSPYHRPIIEGLFSACDETPSANLLLHRYHQHLNDLETDEPRKATFMMILQENCHLLDDLISEKESTLTISELFDYLNTHHPYKVERVLKDYLSRK